MKKLFFLLLVLASSFNLYAQKEDIYMKSILDAAGPIVNLIERENGQEIVRMEFDIVRDSKTTFRQLSSDYVYGICAFGDNRIRDIDIKVYRWTNNQWVLVEKDEDSESLAAVSVAPTSTADYKIVISAYSFEPGCDVGHYGLIIFHE